MQVQPQLGMEPKPNQVCMMIFDHDSVLVIILHINLAWFGLCFDLRSNLHAARKLTWMYMGINLQARVFFCFFLFWAVGATFSMRFRRSAGQNTRDWPCAVGCRTRGHTRPGPRAFRAKSGRLHCRVVGEVAGRGRVGQDDVRGVPGPHPRGGRRRPRQGVWAGGSGALGGPGTDPPAPWSPPPARRTASYR